MIQRLNPAKMTEGRVFGALERSRCNSKDAGSGVWGPSNRSPSPSGLSRDSQAKRANSSVQFVCDATPIVMPRCCAAEAPVAAAGAQSPKRRRTRRQKRSLASLGQVRQVPEEPIIRRSTRRVLGMGARDPAASIYTQTHNVPELHPSRHEPWLGLHQMPSKRTKPIPPKRECSSDPAKSCTGALSGDPIPTCVVSPCCCHGLEEGHPDP